MVAVIPPDKIYRGKSYSEWVCDWSNWYWSVNPDQTSYAPVVFTRCVPSPSRLRSVGQDNAGYESAPRYLNMPNVMVGKERINICADQALLFPLITATSMAIEPNVTEFYMRQWVRNQNDTSELLVNGQNFSIDEGEFPLGDRDIGQYRIETPIFQINIPESQGGTSLREFENPPIVAGYHHAVVDGYFLLLNGFKAGNTHTIWSSIGGSPRSTGEEYSAASVIEIKVHECSVTNQSLRFGGPSPVFDLIEEELEHKVSNNVLSESDKARLMGMINRQKQKQEILVSEMGKLSSEFRKLGRFTNTGEKRDRQQVGKDRRTRQGKQ